MPIIPLGLLVLPITWTFIRPAERALVFRTLHRIWPVARPLAGWICLGLGVLGLILPILQGVLFLVLGAALIGPRHPVIRWTRVQYKRLLRHMIYSGRPSLRNIGLWLRRMLRQMTRQMAHFHQQQHGLALARRRFRVALVPDRELWPEINQWRRQYDPAYYLALPPHIGIIAASRSLHRVDLARQLDQLCASQHPFTVVFNEVIPDYHEHRLLIITGVGSQELIALREQIQATITPPVHLVTHQHWPALTIGKLHRHSSLETAYEEVRRQFQPRICQVSALVLFEERLGHIWYEVQRFPFKSTTQP